MKSPEPKRRITALMMADVVGYSRLVGQDEAGTVARVRALRNEVLEPTIAAKGGRLVKAMGDGFLVEFGSAVDAAACAVEIQTRCEAAITSGTASEPLRLRIGVHVGDVLLDGDDLLGDGVNVVARLEGLAEPGGIALSADTHRHVEGKLPHRFEDAGEHALKNITKSMRVYRWRRDVPASAAMNASLPLPDKPSIAVLPFQNLSGDLEQEYFADGMVEEIITALSRLRWLFVIARNSSFTYKGKAVDIKQVGRELGVRYVLEGSVRKAGGRVRITGQLIDAANGAHIWADRFDRELADIFDVQDEITQKVTCAIEPKVRTVEIARSRLKPTESLDAYDLYLRSLPEIELESEAGHRSAEKLLLRAIALDSNYSDAWVALADCKGHIILGGWSTDRKKDCAEACKAVLNAVRLDPDNAMAHAFAGWALALFGDNVAQAVEHANRAVQLHPNSYLVQLNAAIVFIWDGRLEQAQEHIVTARRFNPMDPRVAMISNPEAAIHFYSERFAEAERSCKALISKVGYRLITYRLLIASLFHQGKIAEAREVADELLRHDPSCTITKTNVPTRAPMRAMIIKALKGVGIPE